MELTPNIGLKPTAADHARVEVWAGSGMSKFVPGAADGWTRRNRWGRAVLISTRACVRQLLGEAGDLTPASSICYKSRP